MEKCGAEAVPAFQLLLSSLCEISHLPSVFVIVTQESDGFLIIESGSGKAHFTVIDIM